MSGYPTCKIYLDSFSKYQQNSSNPDKFRRNLTPEEAEQMREALAQAIEAAKKYPQTEWYIG